MRLRLQRHQRILVVASLVSLLFAVATGCSSVEPWERERLAALRMQDEPHASHASFVDHVRQSREAAAAGPSSSGAGCGCY